MYQVLGIILARQFKARHIRRCLMGFLLVVFTLNTYYPSLNTTLGAKSPSKDSYTIVIYGDSMVDTMGESLEYLSKALQRRYPATRFHYYNYGIGGENVEQGLQRFHTPFNYKTRSFPALSSHHPDIIIIGSFAYNPFSPHFRDKHWRVLSQLVTEAKNTGADVYLLAEIAPLRHNFGKGPGGVNWPEDLASQQSKNIVEQLENTIYLATDHQKVPLINAYSISKIDGKFGNRRFVDPHDNIHPSVEGHKLMAELIAAKIRLR
jgi:hypothetical protein